jgi:hypothetical protein
MTELLPYGTGTPTVVYDNDEAVDIYTDEFVMSLATTGRIRLAGLLTSTSVAPFNRHVPADSFAEMQRDRLEAVIAARRSGFSGVPDPLPGAKGNLERPSTGVPADTKPVGSPGAAMICDVVGALPADEKLLLIMGGPLTVAADAILSAPEIASRITIAWLGGGLDHMGDYNGWADPWAATVVASNVQLVSFPTRGDLYDPKVSKEWIRKALPDCPTRDLMLQRFHETTGLPDGRDADGPPALPLVTDAYVQRTKRARIEGSMEKDGHKWIPVYVDDPDGNIRVVTEADGHVGTHEWRRAFLEAFA